METQRVLSLSQCEYDRHYINLNCAPLLVCSVILQPCWVKYEQVNNSEQLKKTRINKLRQAQREMGRKVWLLQEIVFFMDWPKPLVLRVGSRAVWTSASWLKGTTLRCGFRLRWMGGGMASASSSGVVLLVWGVTGVAGAVRKPMWAGGGTCLPRVACSPVTRLAWIGSEGVRGIIAT